MYTSTYTVKDTEKDILDNFSFQMALCEHASQELKEYLWKGTYSNIHFRQGTEVQNEETFSVIKIVILLLFVLDCYKIVTKY